VVVVAVLLGGGLAGTADAQTADPAVGCYEIEVGEWDQEREPSLVRTQTPPRVFRLYDQVGTATPETGRQLVRPLVEGSGMPRATWRRIDSDSIQVDWWQMLHGVSLRLETEGDKTRGIARALTDHEGAPVPAAPVTGHRIDCEGTGLPEVVPEFSDEMWRDSAQAVIRRIERRFAPQATWRDRAESRLQPAAGTVRGDSIFMEVREDFGRRMRVVTRSFADSAFQAMIHPAGAWGQRFRLAEGREHQQRAPENALASEVIRFLAEHGIRSLRAEGQMVFLPSDETLLDWFGSYLTASMREFLAFSAEEQRRPPADDAALMVPPDEMRRRLAAAERYLADHADALAHDLMRQRYDWYLFAYLAGLRTHPLEGEVALLKREWREAEELAAIADDLLFPRHLRERLRSLKRDGRRGAAGSHSTIGSGDHRR
jgi:hypothetical protein